MGASDTIVEGGKTKCDEKYFENVFAVQIARPENCIINTVNGTNAMNGTLPSICLDEDRLGITDRFIFFGEATLNPMTKTMPDENCLIDWRLLRFETHTGATDLSE